MYPRARLGDPIAYEALMGSIYGLALHFARRFAGQDRCHDVDFFMQEGLFGFVRGVGNGRWNPRRGSWSTYISYYIQGQMMAAIGREANVVRMPKGHSSVVSLDAFDGYEVVERRGPEGLDLDDRDRLEDVLKAMLKIDPRYAAVLKMRTLDGMTMAQVGSVMDLSKERVRQIQNKAIDELKYLCGVN